MSEEITTTPDVSLVIESIIFVGETPVNLDSILEVLNQRDPGEHHEGEELLPPKFRLEEVERAMEGLLEKYTGDQYPFEIRKVAKGYQFFTKREFYPFVRKASMAQNKKRLSRAAMETLAIIAYRQPVTKAEVEFIRGVGCDYAIQKLLEKQLVLITGRADAVGRPLLYAISDYFMQYFGINGVEDLPKLKEFEEMTETHLEEFKSHMENIVEGENPSDGRLPANKVAPLDGTNELGDNVDSNTKDDEEE
ncbi:SMC-Scp complex subunit ScpB [bacterium]|nr:SMC-Scp complex subunit ScpB [bacterium]